MNAITTLALLGLTGCMSVHPRAPVIAQLERDLAAGEVVYTQSCASCHGDDGLGSERALHGDRPVNLDTASHWYRAPVFITMIIEGIDDTTMEPYEHFSDQEIADVYGHILALPIQ